MLHVVSAAFLPAGGDKHTVERPCLISSLNAPSSSLPLKHTQAHTHRAEQLAASTTAMTAVVDVCFYGNGAEDEMRYLLEIQDHPLQNRIELLPASSTPWS